MLWNPFHKPLGDVAEADLMALLDPGEEDRVQEGLLVEFKRDWTNDRIARAAASFANSHGGTLMIGVEAKKLVPVAMPGIEGDPGALQERVVQVLRSTIAPIPDFVPHAVPIRDGASCVVLVEVPEGRLPPYLHIKSGVLYERTPTQSDPVPIHSRDTLDRLFAKGERGARWARDQVERRLKETRASGAPPRGLVVWTAPCAEDGLGKNAVVFRKSFAGTVRSKALGYLGGGEWRRDFATATGDYVTYTTPDLNSSTQTVEVTPSGIVTTTWAGEMGLADENVIGEVMKAHAELLEFELGHRGDVAVAVFSHFRVKTDEVRWGWLVEPRVPVRETRSLGFCQQVHRQLRRSVGYGGWEPEASHS